MLRRAHCAYCRSGLCELVHRAGRSHLAFERRAGDGTRRTIGLGELVCGMRCSQFLANQFEPRRTHAGKTGADLLLNLLDELDEFGHCVHAEERQEPAVELECLSGSAPAGEVEEIDGLLREGVYETCNPSHGSSSNAFHDGVVDADEHGESIGEQSANCGNPADIG